MYCLEMSKEKIAGSRNRLAGKAYEEEIIRTIDATGLFPNLGRTEEINKGLDKKKLDIVPIDKTLVDEFEYKIQAKSTTRVVQYNRLLKELRDNFGGIPVILHKKTERVSDDRFLTEGRYAMLYQQDFLEIIADLKRFKEGYSLLSEYWDSISDEEQRVAHKRLSALGL